MDEIHRERTRGYSRNEGVRNNPDDCSDQDAKHYWDLRGNRGTIYIIQTDGGADGLANILAASGESPNRA